MPQVGLRQLYARVLDAELGAGPDLAVAVGDAVGLLHRFEDLAPVGSVMEGGDSHAPFTCLALVFGSSGKADGELVAAFDGPVLLAIAADRLSVGELVERAARCGPSREAGGGLNSASPNYRPAGVRWRS
jgi:hypothetical protein